MPDFTTQVWGGERIYMIRFARAKTGAAHMDYPDVDDIGFTDDGQAAEHGQIINAINGDPSVHVRFERVEISTAARLYAVSTDPALVRIVDPASGILAASRAQTIRFATGPAGGRAAIEIRYQWPDGPVIGRLYVQVNARVNVFVRLHLVKKVLGVGHGASFLGDAAASSPARGAAMKKMFRLVNHIWVPYGVFFQVAALVSETENWDAALLGSATYPPTDNSFVRAGALTANRDPNMVNFYFVPALQSATAFAESVNFANTVGDRFPVGAAPAAQHLGNGVFVRTDRGSPPSAVAHELGHYLNLCAIDGAQPWAYHSSADQKVASNNQKIRDDSITRRRLLYPYTSLPNMAAKTWRNNVGYGNLVSGCMLSSRQLTQDVTLGEVNRARTAVGNAANLYAP